MDDFLSQPLIFYEFLRNLFICVYQYQFLLIKGGFEMKRLYTAVIVIMLIIILLFTTVNVTSRENTQRGTKMLSYSKSGYEQNSLLGKFKLREITEKDVKWLEMIIQKKEMNRNLYYE